MHIESVGSARSSEQTRTFHVRKLSTANVKRTQRSEHSYNYFSKFEALQHHDSRKLLLFPLLSLIQHDFLVRCRYLSRRFIYLFFFPVANEGSFSFL